MNFKKKLALAGLLLCIVAIVIVGCSTDSSNYTGGGDDQLNPPTSSTVPIKIVNNSKVYADKDVYVVICGHDASDRYYYYDFKNNRMRLVTDLKDEETYHTTLDKIGTPGDRSFNSPTDNLLGGRMYISLKNPLSFHVNDNDPKKWATPNMDNEDQYTIFDKIEFCCDSKGKFTINTTCVDFFGMGFGLEMKKSNETAPYVYGFDVTRNSEVTDLFANLADSDIWKKCLVTDDKGNVMRVKSPGKITDGTFTDFLKDPIHEGWQHYVYDANETRGTINKLVVSYDKWTYTGFVKDGKFEVDCYDHDANQYVGRESISEPTTEVVFACEGGSLPNSGDDWQKKLHALFGSALNRGVFAEDNWSKNDNYYTRADGKYNFYAKKLHEKAKNKKCYAFPYDDIFGKDTTCDAQYSNIDHVKITIPEMPEIKK